MFSMVKLVNHLIITNKKWTNIIDFKRNFKTKSDDKKVGKKEKGSIGFTIEKVMGCNQG